MADIHEPIWRDGQVLTRQHWQRFDRINAHPKINGKLVLVQGGRSRAPASGTTHRLLGCADYRRWNLTNDEAWWVTRLCRDPALVGGGTGHERTTWQGFEPHFHDATLGDDIPGVMDAVAIEQINGPFGYKNGGDGVSGTVGDWQPWRPDPIRNYVYLEDPDMTPDERQELFRIGKVLDQFKNAEWARDKADRLREKERFTTIVTMMGKEADALTVLINQTKEASTKQQLRRVKERILLALKEDPDVTGVDNPDDDQMP